MNSTVVGSHSFSPFSVVFGFEPSLPLDLAVQVKAHTIEDLFAMRTKISLQVQDLLATTANSMKTRADTHRRDSDWAVGDRVLLAT